MKRTKKEIGDLGEQLAEKYLKKSGFRILARNYIARGGEIDIVGYKRGALVYFEVKARSGDKFGSPAQAVDEAKLACIKTAARSLKADYCKEGKIPVFYPFGLKIHRRIRTERIDTIEIYFTCDMKLQKLNHIKDMENLL